MTATPGTRARAGTARWMAAVRAAEHARPEGSTLPIAAGFC